MTTPRATAQGTVPPKGQGRALLRAPERVFRAIQWFVGRRLSVRWKLTIWYTLMYGVTLVIIGLSLPRLLEIRTQSQIDQSLKHSAAVLSERVQHLPPGPAQPGTGAVSGGQDCEQWALAFCGQLRQLLDQYAGSLTKPGGQFAQILVVDDIPHDHAVLLRPRNVPYFNFEDSVVFYMEVASENRPKYRDVTYNGVGLRLYATPLPIGSREGGRQLLAILNVYQPVVSYSETQHSLAIILLGMSPVALFLSLLLGWWIARAALRPIGRISRTVQAIGTSRDLSRRINFVGPRDEVGRLAETFDGMMDRLEQAFESQKQFVADASHELRTPLTAIRGNADLLRIAPADERDICITAIQREAERMSRLVSDLLLLAEADIAEQPVHKRRIDLLPVVEEVHRSASVVASGRVQVVLDADDSVYVDADPDRIKQLLLNLADNAVKFTPTGGTVTIGLRRDGRRALIDVKDTGIGIAPAEQEAIFRRFYRVDKSRATRGTGLGLAISAWIVQAHEGDLELKSAPGKGSRFTVCLPLAGSPPIERARDYSAQPERV